MKWTKMIISQSKQKLNNNTTAEKLDCSVCVQLLCEAQGTGSSAVYIKLWQKKLRQYFAKSDLNKRMCIQKTA